MDYTLHCYLFSFHSANTIRCLMKGSHDIYNYQTEKKFNKLLTSFALGAQLRSHFHFFLTTAHAFIEGGNIKRSKCQSFSKSLLCFRLGLYFSTVSAHHIVEFLSTLSSSGFSLHWFNFRKLWSQMTWFLLCHHLHKFILIPTTTRLVIACDVSVVPFTYVLSLLSGFACFLNITKQRKSLHINIGQFKRTKDVSVYMVRMYPVRAMLK